jgi:hypothetical protein
LDAKCCETIICETISIARKQPAPKTPITIEELTISPGSRQKRVLRAGTTRLIPGYAHATYFSFPNDTSADSVTTQLRLRTALDLPATYWLNPTLDSPLPDPATA